MFIFLRESVCNCNQEVFIAQNSGMFIRVVCECKVKLQIRSAVKMCRMIVLILIYFIQIDRCPVSTGKVSSIYTKDGNTATRGNNIQIICDISMFSGSYTVSVYKTDSKFLRGSTSEAPLTVCVQNVCLTTEAGRYTFSADNSHVYINITNLNRSEDQKWWTCVATEGTDLFLNVFTIPNGIALSGDTNGGDLQSNDVTLRCQTSNCVYPSLQTFQWFYRRMSGPWISYQNKTSSGSTSSCSDSERIYNGMLYLPRNTVWPLQPSDVETTVQFQCRVSFPTLQSELQSAESGNVLLAVRVTAVTLKDNDTLLASTDIIHNISDFPKTFTCTPSTSRPAATIVWYIGNTERQHGTSAQYVYNPNEADNNKRIYCKAFNIHTELNAVTSEQPTLFITDMPSAVSFFVGGHLGQNDIILDEHDEVDFTCTAETDPSFTLQIRFEDKVLIQSTEEPSLSFTRSSVDCHHAGVYTCMATYYGRQASGHKTLSINCSPRPIRQTNKNVTSQMHVPVTLSFMALAYPQPGRKGFSWFKENGIRWSPVRSNEDVHIMPLALQSNLTVLNLTSTDYGPYRVTVNNSIGSYEEYFFLFQREGQSDTGNCSHALGSIEKTNNTALIVGLSLGSVCIFLAVYAIYMTLLYKRVTTNKDNKRINIPSTQGVYTNETFKVGTIESEGQEYEQTIPGESSTTRSSYQYAELDELSRGGDRTAYDTLQSKVKPNTQVNRSR